MAINNVMHAIKIPNTYNTHVHASGSKLHPKNARKRTQMQKSFYFLETVQ